MWTEIISCIENMFGQVGAFLRWVPLHEIYHALQRRDTLARYRSAACDMPKQRNCLAMLRQCWYCRAQCCGAPLNNLLGLPFSIVLSCSGTSPNNLICAGAVLCSLVLAVQTHGFSVSPPHQSLHETLQPELSAELCNRPMLYRTRLP